jgi:secreted trypsin-like serine protease
MKRKIAIAAAAVAVAATAAMVAGNALADDVDPKIIGGQPASEDYEFIASLQYEKNGNPNSHRCGVTLIDPQWVIAAAHCVVDDDGTVWDPARLHISIGSTDNTQGTHIQVDDIHAHPDYMGESENDGDLSLLHLAEPASQQPIELGGEAAVGSKVRQVGWGRTVADDPASLPKELQEIDSTVLEADSCLFGDEWQITPGDICVDSKADAGACYGDSGSPLLQKNTAGEWVILGMDSRSGGSACLETDEVYTGVAYYKDWITETLNA